MSQPSNGPDGLPSATPTPPTGDPTVQYPAGADPTVQYPAGQPVPPQYAPGQSAPQYGAAQPAPYGAPQAAPNYPASAPPYAGQVSGPPVSAPGYAPPMSAPPVSGPAYGQPMSAPPGMPPYGAPPAGRSRTVLVLAVVAALLFVVSGVMTGLFVTKNSELNRTEKRLTGQVSQRDGTIRANTTEIAKLRTDLQAMQDKLDNTEQDLTGTRNDRDEQARQKKVIASCLDKLTTALGAAAAGNKGAYDSAMKGLDKVCDEAENYL
ncbi:hypothetical protein [Micromonospora sp. WMMD710]|uniref:hypothetical protein n=1 Tax=Micromonospora sp. WMMD710 TaxID=3016085 RepID=UPI002417B565|nr:hypothetical protein [Micromonospora sp. WMMD710]MDG4759344.1 hypothetical protein [Micromonospora sp. WMMD710]